MILFCLLCVCLLLCGRALRRPVGAALEDLWLSLFGKRALARAAARPGRCHPPATAPPRPSPSRSGPRAGPLR
jgi:hypothetical protein